MDAGSGAPVSALIRPAVIAHVPEVTTTGLPDTTSGSPRARMVVLSRRASSCGSARSPPRAAARATKPRTWAGPVDEYVFGALRAGASAFLLKGVEADTLIDAVRTVHRGDSLLDPGATRRLIEAYVARGDTDRQPAPVLSPSLTAREVEIVKLVARGLTNAEIGEHLHISVLTCKSHVSSVLTKLGARDRTQVVVLAYESGLVVPGDSNRQSLPPLAE